MPYFQISVFFLTFQPIKRKNSNAAATLIVGHNYILEQFIPQRLIEFINCFKFAKLDGYYVKIIGVKNMVVLTVL